MKYNPASYAFKITTIGDPEIFGEFKGRLYASAFTPSEADGLKAELKRSKAERVVQRQYFRLYDDDGNFYLGGFAILGDDCDGFEPLDEWAMPAFGATEIRYKSPKTGKFEIL